MSSSKHRASFEPGVGFKQQASVSKPGMTQMRLAPLDKKPMVTPRAPSGSSSKPKAKGTSTQPSLRTTFKKQQARASASASSSTAGRASASTSKGNGKENAGQKRAVEREGSSNSDCEIIEDVKPGGFLRRGIDRVTSLFRGPSLPPEVTYKPKKAGLGRAIINPSAPRRGPTIEFDGDDEPPSGDDEMADEPARRKRKRVHEGGRGRLDLVPVEDHEGFGESGTSSDRKRAKRELSMVDPALHGVYADLDASSSAEPDTLDGSGPSLNMGVSRDLHNQDRFLSSEPAAADERGSSAPPSSQPRGPTPSSDKGDADRVLASATPESDEEVFQSLAVHHKGGPDDSGYASNQDADEPMDDDAELLEDSQMPYPSLAQQSLLGRTISAVLMPPPPLPKPRVLAPASTPPVDSLSLSNETKSPRPVTNYTDLPDYGYTKAGARILAPETQELFSFASAADSPSGSPPFKSPPHPSQSPEKRRAASSAAAWSGLAAAWEGQHGEPVAPPVPRQSSLSEFFSVPARPGAVEAADVDERVEDSQFGLPMSLEEAYLANVAREATRRASGHAGGDHLGKLADGDDVDDILEPDGPDTARIKTARIKRPEGYAGGEVGEDDPDMYRQGAFDDDDMVIPSSDPEDGPFSPLGTPERLRSPSPLVVPSPGQVQPDNETQWESYWTVASSLPPPPVDEDEDEEPVEAFVPPGGW